MKSIVHRWVRQPNLTSDVMNRVANRHDPFKNTLTVLEDPQNDRKLFLVGTTNSSTALAYRTKKLIEDISPNSVYVQATPLWWRHAKHTDVKNQEDFNQVAATFDFERPHFENNIRGMLWRLQFHSWFSTMRLLSSKNLTYFSLGFPSDFKAFTPGLEIKFALDAAEKIGAESIFGGKEVDSEATEALRSEPHMYPITSVIKMNQFFKFQDTYSNNYHDYVNVLHTRGSEAFAESMDRSRINFLVAIFNKIAPAQKKILVDWRDERIFRDLY